MFVKPELLVVKFAAQDIVTTSGATDDPTQTPVEELT